MIDYFIIFNILFNILKHFLSISTKVEVLVPLKIASMTMEPISENKSKNVIFRVVKIGFNISKRDFSILFI